MCRHRCNSYCLRSGEDSESEHLVSLPVAPEMDEMENFGLSSLEVSMASIQQLIIY